MRLEDVGAVRAIELQCYSRPWTADSFAYEIRESPASRLLVVEGAESEILGYLATWLLVDELHINNVAVDPRHRRRGLAECIVQHAVREARLVGARTATLEVRESNYAALGLYEKLGFRLCGRRPKYYEDPSEDGLILTCDLDALDSSAPDITDPRLTS